MAEKSETKSLPARLGPSIIAAVILGGLLGHFAPPEIVATGMKNTFFPYVLGVAWAFLVLQWLDIAYQSLASKPPTDLDLGDAEQVKACAEKLTGHQELTVRARILLESWMQTGSARMLVDLAALQSRRAMAHRRVDGVVVLFLLIPCLWQRHDSLLAWGALAALALTVYVRYGLLNRIDNILEARLLARLPGKVAGTTITAAQIGEALGGAIENAFKTHVPQPDQVAAAISSAVQTTAQATADQVSSVQKAFIENQAALIEKLAEAEKQTLGQLSETQKSLAAISGNLGKGLQSQAKDLSTALGNIATKLNEGLAKQLDQVSTAGGAWEQKLEESLTKHAETVKAATDSLATHLNKIAELEQEIEKVLHVQEAVDGAVKSIAGMEEFRATLTELRSHISESDKLLREATRPRTIRLIEREAEVEQPKAKPKQPPPPPPSDQPPPVRSLD